MFKDSKMFQDVIAYEKPHHFYSHVSCFTQAMNFFTELTDRSIISRKFIDYLHLAEFWQIAKHKAGSEANRKLENIAIYL